MKVFIYIARIGNEMTFSLSLQKLRRNPVKRAKSIVKINVRMQVYPGTSLY